MNQENYERLIREWAQLAGAPDVDSVLERGRVKVRDTVIDLVLHEEEAEPLVLLIGHFGKLPTNDGGAAALALLHANFTLQVLGHNLCWSVNPRTEQVIAHARLPLELLDAPALHECLQAFAALAELWHTTVKSQATRSAPLTMSSA